MGKKKPLNFESEISIVWCKKKNVDLMVTHNPVKLVLKQTLILKNSATINIYLCSVPDRELKGLCVFASPKLPPGLVTVWVLMAVGLDS